MKRCMWRTTDGECQADARLEMIEHFSGTTSTRTHELCEGHGKEMVALVVVIPGKVLTFQYLWGQS